MNFKKGQTALRTGVSNLKRVWVNANEYKNIIMYIKYEIITGKLV